MLCEKNKGIQFCQHSEIGKNKNVSSSSSCFCQNCGVCHSILLMMQIAFVASFMSWQKMTRKFFWYSNTFFMWFIKYVLGMCINTDWIFIDNQHHLSWLFFYLAFVSNCADFKLKKTWVRILKVPENNF